MSGIFIQWNWWVLSNNIVSNTEFRNILSWLNLKLLVNTRNYGWSSMQTYQCSCLNCLKCRLIGPKLSPESKPVSCSRHPRNAKSTVEPLTVQFWAPYCAILGPVPRHFGPGTEAFWAPDRGIFGPIPRHFGPHTEVFWVPYPTKNVPFTLRDKNGIHNSGNSP